MDAIIAETQRASKQAGPAAHAIKAAGGAAAYGEKELPERIAELVYQLSAHRKLSDLVLSQSIVSEISEFIYEQAHSALLRANSLEPRHTVLLVGPPGNGKTSLAEVLATELSLPLLSIRYDALVDSFLGETANRLRRLVDFAALNPCILFFDEFDAVGKERSDAQETGEIKRVVSSLLMQMDRLPSHAIVVCATNHPELLDRAVWRRFEMKLEIERPDRQQLEAWFSKFERSLAGQSTGISATQFADCMLGESMSAVEAFTLDVRRKLVLSHGSLSVAEAVNQVLLRLNKRPKKPKAIRENGKQLPARAAQKRAPKSVTDPGSSQAEIPYGDPLPKAT
jgi:DNA replication protein DnaC